MKWKFAILMFLGLMLHDMPEAGATLNNSFQFNGRGNWSIDGVGSTSTPVGTLDVSVPTGSTIEAAFLYSSLFNFSGPIPAPTVVFEGTTYDAADFTFLGSFNPIPSNSNFFLGAYRADVTAQVATLVGGGGGPFSFTVNSENPNNLIDGEVLAVIYSNPSEQIRTIAFLDGFSTSGGDMTTVSLAEPLDLTTPGFEALLSLGINFSASGQTIPQFSEVAVDGRRLTSSAGSEDDGALANGALITVGGLGDSPLNPANPFTNPSNDPRIDDELYNLALGNAVNPSPFLTQGANSFTIMTRNPSLDDNIFFAGINITAEAVVNPPTTPSVPEPFSGLGILAFGALGAGSRLLRKHTEVEPAKNRA